MALIEEFQRLSETFDDTLHLEKEIILFRPFNDSWPLISQVLLIQTGPNTDIRSVMARALILKKPYSILTAM